jgi:hypothetical protein
MNNRTEVQRILQNQFPSLKDNTDKCGWLNEIVFDGVGFDPHKAAIKLGESLEPILHSVAKLRYAGGKLPRSVAGHGVSQQEADNYYDRKYEIGQATNRNNAVPILTRLDPAKLSGFVAARLETFFQARKITKSLRLGVKDFLKISNDGLAEIPLQDSIVELSVDLCLLERELTLLEMKSTFDTDAGKTEQELSKMIKAFIAVGNKPKQLLFGVISNNKGFKRNGEWCGRVGSFVSKELILVESQLWSLLAPQDVSFDSFINLFSTQYSLNLPKHKK